MLLIASNFGNSKPREPGKEFEEVIGSLLDALVKAHPEAVTVRWQPRLALHDSEIVIPDFELAYRLHHQREKYLIECQNRKRTSQDICRKIRHVKSLSDRNRFIFVCGSCAALPRSVKQSLDSDGTLYYDLTGFMDFLKKLSRTLSSLKHDVDDTEFLDALTGAPPLPETMVPHIPDHVLKKASDDSGPISMCKVAPYVPDKPVKDAGMLSKRY